MIYRAKLGLQTATKPLGTYSPMYSPSHQKKSSVLKQNKFSPKPSQRENKQNIEHKQAKTDRGKQEKYFKISKNQSALSTKKINKNSKISLSISINEKKKSISQFDDLNLLNIQTPKFKCSSNKIDDRCKTQNNNHQQNYFSFGDQFRQNIKLNQKLGTTFIGQNNKKPSTPLKQKNRPNINNDQEIPGSQKFSIDALKKKEKMQRMKQTQEKLQQRFLNFDKQVRQSKFKRERDIFCFKK